MQVISRLTSPGGDFALFTGPRHDSPLRGFTLQSLARVEEMWGDETTKALELFRRSHSQRAVDVFPEVMRAFGWVKEAAALANYELGGFDNVTFPDGQKVPAEMVRDAIVEAAREWASGRLDGQMPLPSIVSGAGTAYNMNSNEVIAEFANRLLWRKLRHGEVYPYHLRSPIHPNDHVNQSQSTNDVNPTASRLGFLVRHLRVEAACAALIKEIRARAESDEFRTTLMVGRTHLQDAVLMTASQIFEGWASRLESALLSMRGAREILGKCSLGATATGTGITTIDGYHSIVTQKLSEVLAREGIEFGIVEDPHLFASTSSGQPLVRYHDLLKTFMIDFKGVCDDLRLHASGPAAGFGEIVLQEMAKGSSIMPGKVNPIAVEYGNILEIGVLANGQIVDQTARAGQAQLNVFLIGAWKAIAETQTQVEEAVTMLQCNVVCSLTLNHEVIRSHVERSYCPVTGLSPVIGYDAAGAIANAVVSGRGTAREILGNPRLLKELGVSLTPDQLSRALEVVENPLTLTRPAQRKE